MCQLENIEELIHYKSINYIKDYIKFFGNYAISSYCVEMKQSSSLRSAASEYVPVCTPVAF